MSRTLRRIWLLLKPYPSSVFSICFFGLLVAASTAGLPKLADLFFNEVLQGGHRENADWIPYAFPLLYAVLGISRYYHFTGVRYLSEVVVAKLRSQLLDKITRLSLNFHNGFDSGSGGLLSRFLNDTTVLQEGIYFAFDLIREPIIAVGIITWMFWTNWRLTITSLLFLPFLIFTLRKVSKSLKKYGHLNREAMDELTSTVKETLDGVRVIQSFNLENEMSRRFDLNLKHYLSSRSKVINREEGISPLNEFIVSLIFMGFAIYAIKAVDLGWTTASQLIAFLMAAGLLQMPIKKIQNAHVRLQQTIVVTDRIYDLLENRGFVQQIEQPKEFPKQWNEIVFENVNFKYGQETILENINLRVKRGEVIALVGESGSGKSTLVNLLERFIDPNSGQIRIDQQNLSDFDLHDLRKNIALVTQDVFLFRDTIERNIHAGDFDCPSESVQRRIQDSARQAYADAFISRMPQAFQSSVGDRGSFLSGGEKQRISIARALFKNAPILILDEATSALDSVSEMEVQKALQQLMHGRTVFIIAHRLATVFQADRILVLKKGRIIEQGTHRELLSQKGEYANFFNLQTLVDNEPATNR